MDGKICEVVPVNGWMRGVWLKKGGSQSVLYSSTYFASGAMISLLMLIVLILLLLRERARTFSLMPSDR